MDLHNLGQMDGVLRLMYELPVTPIFEMPVKLDKGAFLPERAHATDAGADIFTPVGFKVPAFGNAIVHTGVHIQLPPNTVGMVKSKSGLNLFHDIITEGVIDEGFTNEIVVKLYNMGPAEYEFIAGDKITQLVVMPVYYPHMKQVQEIEGGERGDAGYGSTGR